MNNISKDGSNFIDHLINNPIFFVQHIPDLSRIAIRKTINCIQTRISARHRGNKQTPHWMAEKSVSNAPPPQGHNAPLALPRYPATSISNFLYATAGGREKYENDPEAYFELNRWAFLIESLLANSTNHESNLKAIVDWLQANQNKEDACWETYSACERISNLLVYLSVVATVEEQSEFQKSSGRFIAESVEWIYGHIEYYGPAFTNNHILNNARALVLGGVAICSEDAIQAGVKIFRECLPGMLGQHGFLRERSSHYHVIAANWVLDAWRFAEAHYGPEHIDVEYLRNLGEKMISAAAMLCESDGRLHALVGDISPDASPQYSSFRLSRLYPEFWPVPENLRSPAEIKDDWFRISRPGQYVLGNFPSGKFPSVFPTHGHCDHTSFVWICDGIEILADSGRYRYTTDKISSLQKSPLGHNVPLVDGYSPLCESLLADRVVYPRPYAEAWLDVSLSNDAIFLSHDGFARATNVTRHLRRIALERDELEIHDSFLGNGEARIRLRWNFGVSFDCFESTVLSVNGRHGIVTWTMNGFLEAPRICSSTGNSYGGWISARYGETNRSISTDAYGRITLPATIVTRFRYRKCAE